MAAFDSRARPDSPDVLTHGTGAPGSGQERQAWGAVDRVVRWARSRRLVGHLAPDARVLDFGCGQENWFLTMNHRRFGSGVGIDPSLRRDVAASATTGSPGGPPNVRGHRSSLEQFRTEHPDERFDVCLWIAVVEHLWPDDARELLRGCREVLRPNGRIVLTTPTPRSRRLLELLAYRLHLISEDEIRDHKHYLDRSTITDLLSSAGFSVVEYRTFQLRLNSLIVAERHG